MLGRKQPQEIWAPASRYAEGDSGPGINPAQKYSRRGARGIKPLRFCRAVSMERRPVLWYLNVRGRRVWESQMKSRGEARGCRSQTASEGTTRANEKTFSLLAVRGKGDIFEILKRDSSFFHRRLINVKRRDETHENNSLYRFNWTLGNESEKCSEMDNGVGGTRPGSCKTCVSLPRQKLIVVCAYALTAPGFPRLCGTRQMEEVGNGLMVSFGESTPNLDTFVIFLAARDEFLACLLAL